MTSSADTDVRESMGERLVRVATSRECCNSDWEAAYHQFETPQEEVRKFKRRLGVLGASSWARDARIVEVFCGRGNGLLALQSQGFTNLEGIDLSESLLSCYAGPGRLYVCDCRQLPFDDQSRDIVVVQGGLHHLEDLHADLDKTLAEVHRVLRPDGIFVVVEPWRTPFLTFVHLLSRNRLLQRIWPKIGAFATMSEIEGEVYCNWLRSGNAIRRMFQAYFAQLFCRERWGKIYFVGRKRESRQASANTTHTEAET